MVRLLEVSYVLRPSCLVRFFARPPTTRSLSDLAIKEANLDGFCLGIDASIWFFPCRLRERRRKSSPSCSSFDASLMRRTTFLPMFIFDGSKRSDIKRGKKINRTSNKSCMKQIVEAFVFEWRTVSDCT